jgi:REP element-mobilizing transposase RayT
VRPAHAERHPVHVTLRARFKPLRSQHVFPTLRRALALATRCHAERFRILQFSVQLDHVHLIVEARDRVALSRGLQGLAIRIARGVNALVRRRGPLWADRWHGRALTTPRAVKRALVYVLANFRKHRAPHAALDPYSSAAFFSGFRELGGVCARDLLARGDPRLRASLAIELRSVLRLAASGTPSPVVAARSWLARLGFRRRGLPSLHDQPASAP